MLFLHKILNGIWAIDPAYAANYMPLVDAYLKGERLQHVSSDSHEKKVTEDNGIQYASLKQEAYELSEYGSYIAPEDAPADSVALIHITGSITKHDQACGPAGMLTKADLLRRCFANDNIKAVVLSIDSGGGEAMAMMHMAENIAKRNKPVGAFIDDFACSAAAGIATACDMVVANSTLARIGSFGTYVTVADYTERYKQMGINLIDVYATASCDKNGEYLQAISGNPEPLRKMVDVFNEHFLSMVEQNRAGKLTADRKTWATGRVWFSEEAMQLGIIDGIDTLDNFINYFNV